MALTFSPLVTGGGRRDEPGTEAVGPGWQRGEEEVRNGGGKRRRVCASVLSNALFVRGEKEKKKRKKRKIKFLSD